MVTSANRGQAEYWNHRAPSWKSALTATELIIGPFGRLAMERLGLRAGERVLDIGCGTGRTTLELAARVTPTGEALGVDISSEMIRTALGSNDPSQSARFEVVDVQDGPIPSAPFDAAFSRFGVMFFADPSEAFARIRGALRPGGRLAFVCWQTMEANEWMRLPIMAASEAVGVAPPEPVPGEPGALSLADRDALAALLDQAGFRDIDIEPRTETMTIPADAVEALVENAGNLGAVRQILQAVAPDTADRALAAARRAIEAKVAGNSLSLGAAAHIVTATA